MLVAVHASASGSLMLPKTTVTTLSLPKRCCRRAPLPGVHGNTALCTLKWETRARETGGRNIRISRCWLWSHDRLTCGKRSILPVMGSSWSFAQLRPLRHRPHKNHWHGCLARRTASTTSRGKLMPIPGGAGGGVIAGGGGGITTGVAGLAGGGITCGCIKAAIRITANRFTKLLLVAAT